MQKQIVCRHKVRHRVYVVSNSAGSHLLDITPRKHIHLSYLMIYTVDGFVLDEEKQKSCGTSLLRFKCVK